MLLPSSTGRVEYPRYGSQYTDCNVLERNIQALKALLEPCKRSLVVSEWLRQKEGWRELERHKEMKHSWLAAAVVAPLASFSAAADWKVGEISLCIHDARIRRERGQFLEEPTGLWLFTRWRLSRLPLWAGKERRGRLTSLTYSFRLLVFFTGIVFVVCL